MAFPHYYYTRVDKDTQTKYLQSAYDFSKRKSGVVSSDEGGGGQLKAPIQVRLIKTVETYDVKHRVV